MLTVLIPVAVLAVFVIIGVIAFQRGRDGFDLSGNTVLRAYLYLGSFAGVIALAFGLSALLNGALATAVGNQIVYGGAPVPAIAPACPPGVACQGFPDLATITLRQQQENDRRRQEDLLRGATFTVFGAIFYGAHRAGRNAMFPRATSVMDHGGLRRAYHLLGTVVFGVGAILVHSLTYGEHGTKGGVVSRQEKPVQFWLTVAIMAAGMAAGLIAILTALFA